MTDILERGYHAMWRERDFEAATPPDFEWVMPGHPEGAVRRGPQETAAFFRERTDTFDELDVDWVLHPAGPDQVLVELHIGQLWTFRVGVPQRMVLYFDFEKARRAAGLMP
jgi:hypothetical protein